MDDSLIEELEKVVLCQVAQKVIESLPDSDKRKILEASLMKSLEDILRPWNVQKAIEKDVNRYMSEYLGRPDVQERVRISTEKEVDKLMDGVVKAIIVASQDAIKSSYKHFLEDKQR